MLPLAVFPTKAPQLSLRGKVYKRLLLHVLRSGSDGEPLRGIPPEAIEGRDRIGIGLGIGMDSDRESDRDRDRDRDRDMDRDGVRDRDRDRDRGL